MRTLEPGTFAFSGRVPGDKSVTHRAILLGALARGTTRVDGALRSADTEATVRLARALGAEVVAMGNTLHVHGHARAPTPSEVDCANSGTTARLGLGIAGGLAHRGVRLCFRGDASLSRRPMARVTEPLRAAGVEVVDQDGHLPACVTGGAFRGGHFVLPVASAQVKSALLLAGVASGHGVTVVEPGHSRDHTERMLRALGVTVVEEERAEGRAVHVPPGQAVTPHDWRVPGDASSAAFFWALGALPGNRAQVEGVSLNPTRLGALAVLQRMGAEVELRREGEAAGEPVGRVVVAGTSALSAFYIGPEEVPSLIDEIPVLAVVALFAAGESTVEGAAELRVKESDRIEVLAGELSKVGAEVVTRPDGFTVTGGRPLHGARLDAHGDHRLAMALAVLATRLPQPSSLEGDEAVAVSFPGFWEALAAARVGERRNSRREVEGRG